MLLIGHRGARNEAPENTLKGFEHIKKLGINSRGQLMNLVLTLGNNQDDDLPN